MDSRPIRRNKAAFLNFSGVEFTEPTMSDKRSRDSCLNRVLIAAFNLIIFEIRFTLRPTPPPPFQCCLGKKQVLET